MKKQILEELNDIKYLFNYNRGKVISEQEKFESEEFDYEEIDLDNDYDEDEEEDINYLKGEFSEGYEFEDYDEEYSDSDEDMDDGEELYSSFGSDGNFMGMEKSMGDMETSEFNEADMPSIAPSKPGIKTPTKPKKPGTPYSPKPGPKKNPKAKKGDMPDWLSFDELGIDFE
jgi:hypothetical protein